MGDLFELLWVKTKSQEKHKIITKTHQKQTSKKQTTTNQQSPK